MILTDTFCEDEGERFLSTCRRCGDKITILGRPAMGTLDYFANINLSVHKHITLTYPIRITKAAYENRGISEKGLPVGLYLP